MELGRLYVTRSLQIARSFLGRIRSHRDFETPRLFTAGDHSYDTASEGNYHREGNAPESNDELLSNFVDEPNQAASFSIFSPSMN